MNHDETMRMVALVRRLRDERGLTVLLVEHDMPAVMKISPTGSSASTSARRSPRARLPKSRPTRASSRPIWAAKTPPSGCKP
jgi:erythromycin esterase-like protein